MGISLSLKWIGMDKLMSKLGSNDTIGKPLQDGIKKITLKYEGDVKKATPFITGQLRSSITHDLSSGGAKVGSNKKYASFVEYGTSKMEARHVEGGAVQKGLPGIGKAKLVEAAGRKYGVGPFTYALGTLKDWLDKGGHEIHKMIEGKFK